MNVTAEFPITFNARGLTDLPLEDGGTLGSRVLFRSDGLGGLTDQGIESFARHQIGTVIDLRTDSERASSADRLPSDDSVRALPLPVLGGDMEGLMRGMLASSGAGAGSMTEAQLAELLDQIPTLEALYTEILEGAAAQFVLLARAVIEAAGSDRPAVLFHCTAGKDRTGIAAALLLGVAGVTREAVVADYVLTGENLAGAFSERMLGAIAGFGITVTPKLRELATESPAPAIEAALDWVAEHHGDAAGYLASAGMGEEELAELKRILRST